MRLRLLRLVAVSVVINCHGSSVVLYIVHVCRSFLTHRNVLWREKNGDEFVDERIYVDTTSSEWYAAAYRKVAEFNRDKFPDASEGNLDFTLLAFGLESGNTGASSTVSFMADASNVTSFIDATKQVHPVYATCGKYS